MVERKKSLTGWANERIVIVKEGERKSRTPQQRGRPAERRSPCPRPPSPARPLLSSLSPTLTIPKSALCFRRCSAASPSLARLPFPRLAWWTRTLPTRSLSWLQTTTPRLSLLRTLWRSVFPRLLQRRRLQLCSVSRLSAVCLRRLWMVRRLVIASCSSLARVGGVP